MNSRVTSIYITFIFLGELARRVLRMHYAFSVIIDHLLTVLFRF
jgi:hypothetical protein